jgi:hypothetical protein
VALAAGKSPARVANVVKMISCAILKQPKRCVVFALIHELSWWCSSMLLTRTGVHCAIVFLTRTGVHSDTMTRAPTRLLLNISSNNPTLFVFPTYQLQYVFALNKSLVLEIVCSDRCLLPQLTVQPPPRDIDPKQKPNRTLPTALQGVRSTPLSGTE